MRLHIAIRSLLFRKVRIADETSRPFSATTVYLPSFYVLRYTVVALKGRSALFIELR